jgi:hypothetical protein
MKTLFKVSVFLLATMTALLARGADNSNVARAEGAGCVASFGAERYAMHESVSQINGAKYLTAESQDYRKGIGARVVMSNWGPNHLSVSVTLKKLRSVEYGNEAEVGKIPVIDETYWNYTTPNNRFPLDLHTPGGDKVGEIQCDQNAGEAPQ